MSHGYVPVQWNRNKIVYDICLWLGIALYLIVFMVISNVTHSGTEALSPMTLLIRAFGSLALILLVLILCIGPMARLNKRLLPLLYNRRHLGVSMFIVALVHGILVTIWYHGFGVINPIESIFTSPGSFKTISDVPFQPFGFIALVILFVMAATSHDYWNANLGAPVWKALHMSVYVAFALVVSHVAFGAMQDPSVGLAPLLVFGSLIVVGGLHLGGAFFSRRAALELSSHDWVDVCAWSDIKNDCGIAVSLDGKERIAVFRYETNKLAAIANVCKHQNGPLGEGRVVDGLITCPWHGFQYRPEDGKAPAPFTDELATYELKLEGDRILLNSTPLPEGTLRPIVEVPALIPVVEQLDV